jgi:hypothetical protein
MGTVIDYAKDGVVVLRGTSVALKSDVGCAFVTDCSRNWEKLFSNSAICEKYGLTKEDWLQMGQNKGLVLAVRAEHQRRIKNGAAAQELAAREFSTAPKVLGDILRDPSANARHKIEAHRELRATAIGTGPEGASSEASDRYIITINLGRDELGRDEKIVVDAGKIAPRAPNENEWMGIQDVAEGQ